MPEFALVSTLRGRTDQFERDMSRAGDIADRAVANIEDRFRQTNPTINLDAVRQRAEQDGASIGTALAAGVVASVAAAAVALGAALKSSIDRLSELGDKADALRLPVNLMQALSVQASLARVSQDSLNSALDHFTSVSKKSAGDAEGFYNALNDVGKGLGDAFKNAPTQSERLRIIADAFSRTTDEVKLAKLGSEALGTENERLINIFQRGREGIDSYISEIKRLGLAINEDAVVASQEAKTQLNLVSRVMSDQFATAIAELIPLFVQLSPGLEMLKDVAAALTNLMNVPIGTRTPRALAQELASLEREAANLQNTMEAVNRTPETFTEKISADLRQLKNYVTGVDNYTSEALQQRSNELQERIDIVRMLLQNASNQPPRPERPAFRPRPGGGEDDADAERNAFTRAEAAANRHIAIMQADADAMGLNADQQVRFRTEAALTEGLLQAGIEINDEYAARIDKIAQAAEEASRSLRVARDQFAGVVDVMRFSGNEMVSVLDRVMQKGADFRSIMGDIMRSVARQLAQAALTGEGAFAKLLGLNTTTPNGVGGLLGGLAAAFGFGGGKAGGGPVEAGKAYIVGEKRPELFVPGRDGVIVPNLGGGGGVAVSYAPVYNVQGSGPEIEQLRLQMAQDRAEVPRRAVAAIRQAQSRRVI